MSGPATIMVRVIERDDWAEWLRVRMAFWHEDTQAAHEDQMRDVLGCGTQVAIAVVRPDGRFGGFAEASIHPRAIGCVTHNIGYLEGWYVEPDLRQQHWGRRLVEAVEAWARDKSCTEMASDTQLGNGVSLAAHLRLGYSEAGRLIHFAKRL